MFLNRIFVFISLCCYGALSSPSGICTSGTSSLSCPDGWLTHRSSCYHFSHDKEAWANAVTICKVLGGHLVEIEDSTENNYLVAQAKLAKKSYWIGLNDLQEENTWVWVDSNTPGTYTNWSKGQPDNAVNNENCALITQGYNFLWNDGQCYTLINYICEKTAENAEIVG